MNPDHLPRRAQPVLVLGATGYVGGRLVPRLLAAGHRVRALGRSLDKLACRPWAAHPHCELAQGDVQDPMSLARGLRGCWAAFYLVHSMNPATRDFAAADRRAARHMSLAAAAAGLERIIYLGGLVPDDPHISHHLRSRAEVGRILQAGAVPCTWLRAAMILGAGSASFELLRYLAERLPVMLTPRWVHSRCQPIAISNVLGYLLGCLEHDEVAGQTFDLGGPDIRTYAQLFQILAQEAGLPRRIIIPVPVFSPRLSSYWIHLVTPVPASLGRPLAEGLRNTVVCGENRIREIIPQALIPCRQAIRTALARRAQDQVESCWLDAGELTPPEWVTCGDAPYAGGTVLRAGYRLGIPLPAAKVWPHLAGVGGRRGWYFQTWLWQLRGALDKLVGGVGLGRGRRSAAELRVGEALDFWRVLAVEPPRRLLLLAQMKLPGSATLEITLHPQGESACEARLVASFLPKGLWGLAYWYGVWPLHQWVFAGMLPGLARAAGAPPGGPARPFDPADPGSCRLPAAH